MVDGARPRVELDGADEAPRRQHDRHDDVAVDVVSAGSKDVRGVEGGNEIRRTEYPARWPRGRGWEVGAVPLGSAGVGPALQRVNLRVREPPFADEWRIGRIRQPRRHA